MNAQQEMQLLEDMAVVKKCIMGNGVKGLAQRMDEEEAWRHSHPRVCPMEAGPNPHKVNRMNVFFAIVGALGVTGSLVVAIVVALK